MQPIGEFHKVSFKQFLQDIKKAGFFDDVTPEEVIKIVYDCIKLPKRATSGSAGYDFFLPVSFSMYRGSAVTIPTGIKVDIKPGWFLQLAPRSSLGFKCGMRLLNTVGIIDSDYSSAENEGHIVIRFTADQNMCLCEGDRFVQGIFIQHGVTENEESVIEERVGGFGSTGA